MSPLFRRRDRNSSGPARAGEAEPGSASSAAASEELRSPRWVVVVPVKPSARAKSRLEVAGVARKDLARAIALDTLQAATACDVVAQVVVVTDDAALARESAMIPGLRFVPEGEAAGLDAAVAAGVAAVDPGGRMPRAALLGDLPALRPDDLGEALRAAASLPRAVVADAEGTGSTLVTAAAGQEWTSAFGDGSFARHVALGCAPLEIRDASTLRRDVDTAAQLDAARTLGLGPRTAALLAGADIAGR
ncbi:2-phospho-L-lactate guanylyltransferase [Microbacterium jejuense]|uniref:Phosphoenolpyruvate guanylyltransferase n=1 Tax=Microbacterium jejuense TaxID=1263637 RepID=A0ABS7HSR8_9MICO|nr:2-phospho-L-lactate guanylyltransferase [Microbacterium jejuense]MBW9095079.1 2-phospho-L-lactate guanylyltransferase [Microbacterium jejuense]